MVRKGKFGNFLKRNRLCHFLRRFVVFINRFSLEVDNKDGKRPIHEAAQHGHADCVAYLIGQNVEVDAFKRADWTPLMLACTKDDLVVVRVLIEEGGKLTDSGRNLG